MKSESIIAICITVVVLALVLFGAYGCHQREITRQEAFKAGLEEIPPTSSTSFQHRRE